MGEALALGLLTSSSLLLGAVIALRRRPSDRWLGGIMAFGAGVLISSVAYELVAEAFATSAGEGGIGSGLLAGALVFFLGDAAIDRLGGEHRKHPDPKNDAGRSRAVVLGTVLDGIPESIVLGAGLLSGTTPSLAMVVAVYVSNLPEGLASSAGLRASGWSQGRILTMWAGIVALSGVAAAIGYGAFADATPAVVAFVLAFAGGAVLTMLADTMMPEAYELGGPVTGLLTTVGFGVGFLLTTLS